jgi:hypothetical protein
VENSKDFKKLFRSWRAWRASAKDLAIQYCKVKNEFKPAFRARRPLPPSENNENKKSAKWNAGVNTSDNGSSSVRRIAFSLRERPFPDWPFVVVTVVRSEPEPTTPTHPHWTDWWQKVESSKRGTD